MSILEPKFQSWATPSSLACTTVRSSDPGTTGKPLVRQLGHGALCPGIDAVRSPAILQLDIALDDIGARPIDDLHPPHREYSGEKPMGFATEFKEFAVKGNVMDLAVGVIIGAAFGKIVDSVVGDLVMPLVSKATGGLDFSNYFIPLAGQTATTLVEAKKAGAVFAYGNFLTVALNFVILAFIIFLMVKQINKLKKAAPPVVAATPEDVMLLREIRDSLKK
jgi:large conductance mechanosensitive channel